MTSEPIPPALSSLTQLISSNSSSCSAINLQVLHNLQYQHFWTSLQIHGPPDNTDESSPLPLNDERSSLPSLISGIPPHHIYTHPDEQLFMLERGLRDDDIPCERVFVLPTSQGQAWSLHKLALVFDTLPVVHDDQAATQAMVETEKSYKLAEYYARRAEARVSGKWGGKMLLLATVNQGMGGDGTIVYYIVQEGAVKPRQN